MNKIFVLMISILAGFSGGAANANIIYSVDRSSSDGASVHGPQGSVHGTITTDGTLGFLGRASIVDWNLTLQSGAFSVAINPANSFFDYQVYKPEKYNHGLFATPQKLEFLFAPSFSTLYSVFDFYGGASVGPNPSLTLPAYFTWCIGTNFCSSDLGYAGELILIRQAGSEGRTVVEYDQMGRETVAAAVPLPGSAALLGPLGLMLVAVAMRRRGSHQTA